MSHSFRGPQPPTLNPHPHSLPLPSSQEAAERKLDALLDRLGHVADGDEEEGKREGAGKRTGGSKRARPSSPRSETAKRGPRTAKAKHGGSVQQGAGTALPTRARASPKAVGKGALGRGGAVSAGRVVQSSKRSSDGESMGIQEKDSGI